MSGGSAAAGWDAQLCPIAMNPPALWPVVCFLQLKGINEERAAQPCFAEDPVSHPKGFISFDYIWGLREGRRHAELGEATARVTPGWVLLEGCNRNPQSSVGSRISPHQALLASPALSLFYPPLSPSQIPAPITCCLHISLLPRSHPLCQHGRKGEQRLAEESINLLMNLLSPPQLLCVFDRSQPRQPSCLSYLSTTSACPRQVRGAAVPMRLPQIPKMGKPQISFH